MSAETPLLNIKQVAEAVGCSTRTINRMASTGKIPKPYKLGALVRWNSNVLDDWIAAGCPTCKRRGKRGAK